MVKVLKGRSLSGGIAEGEAMVSNQPFSITAAFAIPLVQYAKKLKVADRTHEFYKKNVTGKVLIFPLAIGTTTTGFVLLETIFRGVGPAAIICACGEPLLSSGALCAEIFFDKTFPIIDQISVEELMQIPNGALIRVNGDLGILELEL